MREGKKRNHKYTYIYEIYIYMKYIYFSHYRVDTYRWREDIKQIIKGYYEQSKSNRFETDVKSNLLNCS